jgi:hypothetical protein
MPPPLTLGFGLHTVTCNVPEGEGIYISFKVYRRGNLLKMDIYHLRCNMSLRDEAFLAYTPFQQYHKLEIEYSTQPEGPSRARRLFTLRPTITFASQLRFRHLLK